MELSPPRADMFGGIGVGGVEVQPAGIADLVEGRMRRRPMGGLELVRCRLIDPLGDGVHERPPLPWVPVAALDPQEVGVPSEAVSEEASQFAAAVHAIGRQEVAAPAVAAPEPDRIEGHEHPALRGLPHDPGGVGEVAGIGRREVAGCAERAVAVGVRVRRDGGFRDQLDLDRVEPGCAPVVEVELDLLPPKPRDQAPRGVGVVEKGPAGGVDEMGVVRGDADGEPRRTETACGGGARRLASGREGEGYQDDKGESGPGSHARDIEACRTPDKGVAPRPTWRRTGRRTQT